VTILKRFCGIAALLACSAPLGICDVVSVIFSRPLPIKNVNNENGPRSNYAFTETGGPDPLLQTAIDGDSFTLCSGSCQSSQKFNSYVITSLSTYSVASVMGQPLGDEFDDVLLAVREVTTDPISGALIYGNWDLLDQGTPDTSFNGSNSNVVLNSNPNITDTNTTYYNGQSYEGDGTGVLYPLWETTFSNLNFTAQAGVQYQFVVWGFGWNTACSTMDFQCMDPNTEYGYWFNEYSVPFLSGRREQDPTGYYLQYVNFANSQLCPDPSTCNGAPSNSTLGQDLNGNNTLRVNQNVIIEGYGVDPVSTPEPGTRTLIGLGFVLFACLSRRLRK
jgi:hypothetical protein